MKNEHEQRLIVQCVNPNPNPNPYKIKKKQELK